jgi:hypothetical protein
MSDCSSVLLQRFSTNIPEGTVGVGPLKKRKSELPLGPGAVLQPSEGNALFAKNYDTKWENENDLEVQIVSGYAVQCSARKKPP